MGFIEKADICGTVFLVLKKRTRGKTGESLTFGDELLAEVADLAFFLY